MRRTRATQHRNLARRTGSRGFTIGESVGGTHNDDCAVIADRRTADSHADDRRHGHGRANFNTGSY
jgi:hypothetical protein